MKLLYFTVNLFKRTGLFSVAFQLKTVKSNPNISHWTPDGGYEAEVNETSFYPFRAFDSTVETSLFTLLTVTTADINYNCALYEGFNFYFSLPGEAAVMSRPTIQAPLSMLSTILITPKLITTSENLRKYAPNQRGCFFNFERQLHFFKIYTQLNCEQECLSNYTKIECDCVEFSLPRKSWLSYSFDMLKLCILNRGKWDTDLWWW